MYIFNYLSFDFVGSRRLSYYTHYNAHLFGQLLTGLRISLILSLTLDAVQSAAVKSNKLLRCVSLVFCGTRSTFPLLRQPRWLVTQTFLLSVILFHSCWWHYLVDTGSSCNRLTVPISGVVSWKS